MKIALGGIAISGAGCIANDLWDRKVDGLVTRTKNRPLASGQLKVSTASLLLVIMLFLSLSSVVALPEATRGSVLKLALLALPSILIYPSAKRWFSYPQAILAICWGFSVLIPWVANQPNNDHPGHNLFSSIVAGGLPLLGTWLAAVMWTFGFDTVYAMSDRIDDKKLGLKSSALTLGKKVKKVVLTSYISACICLAIAAFHAGIGLFFWPFWLVASIGMIRTVSLLKSSEYENTTPYGKHFQYQVYLGGVIFIGLFLGRLI